MKINFQCILFKIITFVLGGDLELSMFPLWGGWTFLFVWKESYNLLKNRHFFIHGKIKCLLIKTHIQMTSNLRKTQQPWESSVGGTC